MTLTAVITFLHSGVGHAQEHKQGAGRQMVQIYANPKTGDGPLSVLLEPIIDNLEGPLRFEWNFGDGTVSTEKNPPSHLFEYGKFMVVLRVTDRTSNVFSASVTIFADYPCG